MRAMPIFLESIVLGERRHCAMERFGKTLKNRLCPGFGNLLAA